jgi:two-component system, chemotaxis family, chemotaxis protein CheY
MPTTGGDLRLKILVSPTGTIDGISFDQFHVGEIYTLGTHVGCVFLAEGWAELVNDDGTAVFAEPADVATREPLVLVVDDDPDMRRLVETLLTAQGYHVILAKHGRDAIYRLRSQCPDLIVLDLKMPVMNGWDFCTEQRYLPDANRATAPVLVMSGVDDAEAQARKLHTAGIVKKPFDPEDLLEAVSAAIGSQRSAPDGIRSRRPRSGRRPPRV